MSTLQKITSYFLISVISIGLTGCITPEDLLQKKSSSDSYKLASVERDGNYIRNIKNPSKEIKLIRI